MTSASDQEVVLFEKKGNLAWITLNRPKALNAYSVRMRDELFEVLGVVRDDPDIHVTILKGAGEKAFCAGADLTEFLTAPPPVFAREARFDRDIWGRFLAIRKPFIAALHGYVLGSGIEMSLCCDVRFCSEDARFGLPEVGLGIIPAAGGSQTLPRAIGPARAQDLLLSGRWIDAAEALRFKLVNRVVPRADLYPEAEKLAVNLAQRDPRALAAAKEAITRGLDMGLDDGLALERRLAGSLAAGHTPTEL
jgi:enoyl-CoA hydratase/carnithine racemase